MPRLSVIMGVYNCAKKDWLRESILSVCNQTVSDFEFLICDDGSSNDTKKWLTEFAENDRRIQVISNAKNQGLATALNHCLDYAAGEYIVRQDDDDISEPTRFERQLNYLQEHSEYALVGSNARVIDREGNVWGQYSCEVNPTKRSFLWTNPFAHPTIMIRTDVLRSLGGYRVAKETKRCEDYDLFMRLYAAGYQGCNLQEYLYQYRVIIDSKKKHRPMKDRWDESVVRWNGYRRLGLLPRGIPYVLKPVVIGMLPADFYNKIVSKKYKIGQGN